MSRDEKQLAATTRPWRVVMDDTGDPITGGYPSICPVDESLDQMIIHWNGFHHEFWDTHPSRPVQVANAKLIVTAVNERDALLSEVAQLKRWVQNILDSGVEFEDSRISYKTMQIEKSDLEKGLALIREGKSRE